MLIRRYAPVLVFVFGFLLGAVGYFAAPPAISFAAGFFYVDESGDVGIGNTSPEHKLDVSGALYSRLVSLSDSSTISVDWDAGNTQAVTLGGNRTIALSNGQPGGHYTLILTQDGTGGRTVTWSATSTTWQGDNPPTLSTGSGATDVVDFIYTGSTYLGSARIGYGGESQVNYLVVAGGGAGGRDEDSGSTGGGGGGAGGLLTGTLPVEVQAYSITVGAGGTGGGQGGSGSNSSIDSAVVAIGGGGGGGGRAANPHNGLNGGSGGGATLSDTAGTGTSGQGNDGASTATGGGGGGCGGAASGSTGGSGCASSISGSSQTYAAGGDGNTGNAVPGAANTGNGGNGTNETYSNPGGDGGSGVVIISYPTGSISATGGSVTTSGGNTIHTFTSSGTFTVTSL